MLQDSRDREWMFPREGQKHTCALVSLKLRVDKTRCEVYNKHCIQSYNFAEPQIG